MRQFFRTLLLALVLMTVALISALTAMQLAIHGREVAIPNLVGMNPIEAERAGAALGLQVVVERQFYSPNLPEGKIMSQLPLPGTKVRRGWSVRVAQSLGPQRVAIPNVTGGSERVAELNIQRRGLSLGSIARVNVPDAPQDQVVSQSPPANASGVSAPKISLLVSDGTEPSTYVMPNLTGQPLGSATLALQDAGMKIGKVGVLPPQAPGGPQTASVAPPVGAGISAQGSPSQGVAPQGIISQPSAASMIVTQTPAPGQKIVAGSSVNFVVR
jgi:eukaryotic-like serine/threonine-protein kinase